MLQLFGFDVNKWVVYTIGLMFLVGTLSGAYFYWKNTIEDKAQLEYNNHQLQKTLEDQALFIEKTKKIAAEQEKAIQDLDAQNNGLKTQLKDLNDYLNDPKTAKEDRGSSEILKTTIRKLQAVKASD